MPTRTDTAAPSFDPEHPRELPCYFMELELLMASARVTAEQQCKLLVMRYVPFDDCQLWSGLPEFSPNLTYEEFKAVILKLYPGATEEQTFTFVDIDRVTSKWLQLGIQSKEELAAYHQQFLAITQYLISCNRLLANKQGWAFLQGFRSEVLQRIYQCLQIKLPDHFPDDPYMLAQIMDAWASSLHNSQCLLSPHKLCQQPCQFTCQQQSEPRISAQCSRI